MQQQPTSLEEEPILPPVCSNSFQKTGVMLMDPAAIHQGTSRRQSSSQFKEVKEEEKEGMFKWWWEEMG